VEYAAKGLWEGTVGALSEAIGGHQHPLDTAYAGIATDYGAFIHHTPWYAFDFTGRRKAMPSADWSVRGLERGLSLRTELFLKGWWGWAMGAGSQAAYGTETDRILAWVDLSKADTDALGSELELVEPLGGDHSLVRIPRYEPFTTAVPELARRGVRFVQIAGGDTLLLQLKAPAGWRDVEPYGDLLAAWPILTEPDTWRITLEVPVGRLHELVPALDDEPVTIEHLYDY
jgi:hypothetical protein